MEQGEELRQRILELLMPDGTPVGQSGRRRSDFRMVQGSLEAAQEFFDEFRKLGRPLHIECYPGEMVSLGGADRVGLRPRSKWGEPTIDVWVQYIPEIRKIKFVGVDNDYAR